jgi:hypothetical protein
MQTLSAFLAVSAAPSTDDPVTALLMETERQWSFTPGTAIQWILIGQVMVILANFLASKLLAVGENGTFLGALRVWMLHWILVIGSMVVAVVVLLAMMTAGIADIYGIVLLLLSILFLAAVVRIPMDVYEITVPRAIGFILAAAVLTTLGNFGIAHLMGYQPQKSWELLEATTALTPAQRQEFFDRLKVRQRSKVIAAKRMDGEDIASDSSRPLPERALALKQVYRDLETQRLALKPGDPVGKDAYELRKARYEALLHELKLEAARLRTAATPPPAD